MIIGVQVGLQQYNSTLTRSYFPEEILLALNKAQDRFIASKVRKVEGKLYEYDIVDEEAINVLIEDRNTAFPSFDGKVIEVKVEDDFQYYVRSKVVKDCGDAVVTLIKPSIINKVQATPFYKSTVNNYNATFSKMTLRIYPHKNTLENVDVELVYIRKPKKIELNLSQGSELQELYHQAIVDLAVGIMKVDSSQPDSNLKDQDNKINSTLLG